MHLLYVDESGLVTDTAQRYFVLAGLSVFEREPHWIEKDLDEIAMRFNADEPQLVELHGSPMRSGKGLWRHVQRIDREAAIADALMAKEFKAFGHSFGKTRNFAEVPVFVESQASRLIQLADLVAYSIFRHFEHRDSRFYDIISHCFDAEGGVTHGLYLR